MNGALLIALGMLAWVLAFTVFKETPPAAYLFAFIGGVLIGCGAFEAVLR